MTTTPLPLWTLAQLHACGAKLEPWPEQTAESYRKISGVSIDSRITQPGDLFVALKDIRDGHAFVPAAFANGAAAALVRYDYVRQPGDRVLARVDDPLAGLEALARAARARLSSDARIVAVTGSVGKTGTKEMLRACLSRLGPTHAPEKSFNNHWGVPLTLARMPASTRYGVIEIGMNHAGEITPLSRLARPHVAIITTVEPVHLGFFPSVEAIADAKAEIVLGLEPGGVAVLNRDNPHFERIAAQARARGIEVVGFGRSVEANVRLVRAELGPDGSELEVDGIGGRIAYRIGAPGAHIAMNSLAVVAALEHLDLDFTDVIHALGALADQRAPQGRGARETLTGLHGTILLVDESYNANPASMRAALAGLALIPRAGQPRRIAVLGDMLELGDTAPALHAGLLDAIDAAGIDLVFAAGPNMRFLYDRLAASRQGAWGPTSEAIEAALLGTVRGGDVVMIKGSLGSRMGPLVTALRKHAARDGERR